MLRDSAKIFRRNLRAKSSSKMTTSSQRISGTLVAVSREIRVMKPIVASLL